MAELGIHQFADKLDDVARGAELAILASAADLIEQHFIDITLNVLKQMAFLAGIAFHFDEDVFDDLDGTLEEVGSGDEKHGMRHVLGEGAPAVVEGLDEWEDDLLDMGQHFIRLHFFDKAPPEDGFFDCDGGVRHLE